MGDKTPVSVDAISLSAQTTDCLINDDVDTDVIKSEDEFTADELYKYALTFYKGTSLIIDCLV